MTLFGWLLIAIPLAVVGLVVWGVREDPESSTRPYDWQADRALDNSGPPR